MSSSQPPADSPTAEPDPGAGEETRAWLVDGYNVLQTVLLGGQPRGEAHWWGPEGRNLLWDRIQFFQALRKPVEVAAAGSAEPSLDAPLPGTVCIVFDGDKPAAEQKSANPWVVFAPSADQWIVKRVRGSKDPGALAVVSADRQLTGRCRHAGARIVAPRDFIARCPPGQS
ncbi:MAG: NYN domain-containing protein [Myxococcota bacterium]|jgi:hypothetical protein|nr:NYN domain-containing protein [Myxococcota bacterium]